MHKTPVPEQGNGLLHVIFDNQEQSQMGIVKTKAPRVKTASVLLLPKANK